MANVQILKIGHALIEGERGAKGGKPSKDSVFGVATIQGNLVTFGGRRGGVLRFKTYKKTAMDTVMAKWDVKLAGSDKGFAYTDITSDSVRETLVPGLEESVGKMFYRAMKNGKLNTRSTKPVAKAAKAE